MRHSQHLAVRACTLALAGCEMLPQLEDADHAAQQARNHVQRVVNAVVAGMRGDMFLAQDGKTLETINGMPAHTGPASRNLLDEWCRRGNGVKLHEWFARKFDYFRKPPNIGAADRPRPKFFVIIASI